MSPTEPMGICRQSRTSPAEFVARILRDSCHWTMAFTSDWHHPTTPSIKFDRWLKTRSMHIPNIYNSGKKRWHSLCNQMSSVPTLKTQERPKSRSIFSWLRIRNSPLIIRSLPSMTNWESSKPNLKLSRPAKLLTISLPWNLERRKDNQSQDKKNLNLRPSVTISSWDLLKRWEWLQDNKVKNNWSCSL